MPSSLLRLDILMQIVCFFSRYCGLRPKRRGSTPVAMSTSISTELSENTSFPEAAMFALCYSLYSCSPHRIDPLRLSPRDWVLLLPSLPMISRPHMSRILLLGCTDNSQGGTSTRWRRSLMGCARSTGYYTDATFLFLISQHSVE